jgi:hypothetical protein
LSRDVKEVAGGWSDYIKKTLRQKKVPISSGVVLKTDNVPELPNPLKQKYYQSFVAKQFVVT